MNERADADDGAVVSRGGVLPPVIRDDRVAAGIGEDELARAPGPDVERADAGAELQAVIDGDVDRRALQGIGVGQQQDALRDGRARRNTCCRPPARASLEPVLVKSACAADLAREGDRRPDVLKVPLFPVADNTIGVATVWRAGRRGQASARDVQRTAAPNRERRW